MWLELLPNSTSATAFLLGTGGGGGGSKRGLGGSKRGLGVNGSELQKLKSVRRPYI